MEDDKVIKGKFPKVEKLEADKAVRELAEQYGLPLYPAESVRTLQLRVVKHETKMVLIAQKSNYSFDDVNNYAKVMSDPECYIYDALNCAEAGIDLPWEAE